MITNQQLFDNAALGIIGQGHKVSIDPETGGCVVLNSDGLRCALGWSCTDVKVNQGSSPRWHQLSEKRLGMALRIAHDSYLRIYGKETWEEQMSKVALEFKLDDSCVYFELV